MDIQPDQALKPTTPAEKVLAAAVVTDAAAVQDFRPSPAHFKLAQSLFETGAQTFVELAAKSGVSRTTIWRLLQEPGAAAWLASYSAQATKLGIGLVHARLLHLALTSRTPAAIELYLKRFDDEFREKSALTGDLNVTADVANVLNMSNAELERFVELKRRAIGKGDKTVESNLKT